MTPIPGKTPVNPEHVMHSLKLTEAKITLHEQKIRTYRAEGQAFRALVASGINSLAVQVFGVVSKSVPDLEEWRAAHKAMNEADLQIMEVSLAELQSQAMLYRAMLGELEKSESRLIKPS